MQTIVDKETSATGRSGSKQEEDAWTRDLLRKLIRKGLLEFKPSLDGDRLHYSEVEETWGVTNITEVRRVLGRLERQGALQSRLIEHVLTCPNCESPDLRSKYTCPKCGSDSVEYTEIIEHLKCGHIGPRAEFTRDYKLFCPNCQMELAEDAPQHRIIGNFYQCEKCRSRFDKPEIVHRCRHCDKTSNYQEAKYVKVFSYRVTEEAMKGFEKDLPVADSIVRILAEKGYQVRIGAEIMGSSGVASSFDILAEKGNARIVIDMSMTGSKNDIIALLAKKIDVKPARCILVDVSGQSGSEELSNFGKAFDISVLKASTGSLSRQELEHLLRQNSLGERRLKQSPSPTLPPERLHLTPQKSSVLQKGRREKAGRE